MLRLYLLSNSPDGSPSPSGLAVFMGLAFEETYKTEERVEPRRHPHLSDARHGRRHALSDRAGARARLCRRPVGLGRLAARLSARARRHRAMRRRFMIPASNLLAYVIGPIALMQPPWVAVALTVTAVLLLGARERLHRLIHIVPRDELLTARHVPDPGRHHSAAGSARARQQSDAAHAVRGLARGRDGLHAVLSELSAAALRADQGRRAAAGGARRRLFLHRHHRGARQAPARVQAQPRRISRPASSRPPRSCMCGSASSWRYSTRISR